MTTETHQLCTFTVGSLYLGVDVRRVQEVIRSQPMTQVRLAPAAVQGLINLRGQIVIAIDLRHRLELPPRPDHTPSMNVVVRTDEGAVSLLVDEIGDVTEVVPSAFEPTPDTLRQPLRSVVSGVYKLERGLLLVLDPDRAVSLHGSEALTK